MRLAAKALAIVVIAALTVGMFTLLASALRAPEPTVPGPIQIRQGDAGGDTPEKERKKKRSSKSKKDRSRKRPKPAPPPQNEGARPVAPPPPPAGDDDDDDVGDDDGDDADD